MIFKVLSFGADLGEAKNVRFLLNILLSKPLFC